MTVRTHHIRGYVKKGLTDLHIASDMVCSDCHGARDAHGDGKVYHSMRDPGAVSASCSNCHDELEENDSHKIHKDKLHCSTCHVSNTLSCYNCHFDEFLVSGKRKGNFIAGDKNWIMLINFRGKVTAGNAQTLVYKGRKFIAYAPYFTHSVMKKGRACGDCHDNAAMKLIKEGRDIPVILFEDGKLKEWKGVFPLVPERLKWVFLDKKDGKWVLMEGDEPPAIQYISDGKPLTKEQLEKLAKPAK